VPVSADSGYDTCWHQFLFFNDAARLIVGC
jgi:hypothetical protein